MQSRKLQTGNSIVYKLLESLLRDHIMVDFLERIHSTGLDFQKAFDKVRHQRLLIKLKSRGMGVNIVTWIQNWLTDRKQRVSVEGISMDCST